MPFIPDPDLPKYDAEAAKLMRDTRARSVVIVICNGKRGNGSCHKQMMTGDPEADRAYLRMSATALREMADAMLEQAADPMYGSPYHPGSKWVDKKYFS